METRQHQCVLPSNDSFIPRCDGEEILLREDVTSSPVPICADFNQGLNCTSCEHQHVCSKCHQHGHSATLCKTNILQTSSGNVHPHHVGIPQIDIKDPQYGIKSSASFASPPFHSAQAAIKREQRRRGSQPMFPIYWDRCEQSSQRYRQYRAKQRSSRSKDGKKEIWTDRVEAAFQIALRYFAGRGRKKQELNGKQCGGNEFIAHWIWLQTGEKVTRKQVSSHIQVLKGFMHDVPAWMSLVKAIPDEKRRRGHGRQDDAHDYESSTIRDFPEAPSNAYLSTRSSTLDLLPTGSSSAPTIRSVKFLMELCDVPPKPQDKATEMKHEPLTHHTYTSIQSEMPSAPRALESISDWRSMWPTFQPHDEYGRSAPVFLFEAGLNLIEEYIPRTQIKISFYVDFTNGNCFQDWHSKTQIRDEKGSTDVHVKGDLEQRSSNDQIMNLNLPFRAHYWVRLFHNINESKYAARASGDSKRVEKEEEHPRRFLANVSVTQELWATPPYQGAYAQRMAVLLWKFHQAGPNEVPTTSWRRLTLPELPGSPPASAALTAPPFGHVNSDPETTKPHDGTLPDSDRMLSQDQNLSADSVLFGASVNRSGENSPHSRIQIDTACGLGSTTARSLPSTISASTYRSRSFQQSSTASQDDNAIYTPLESIGSQDHLYNVEGSSACPDTGAVSMSQEHQHYPGSRSEFEAGAQQADFSIVEGYQTLAADYSSASLGENHYMIPHGLAAATELPLAFDEMQFNMGDHPSADGSTEIHQDAQDVAMNTEQLVESTEESYPIPILAPKAQVANHLHVLQLEHFDKLQRQASGEHQDENTVVKSHPVPLFDMQSNLHREANHQVQPHGVAHNYILPSQQTGNSRVYTRYANQAVSGRNFSTSSQEERRLTASASSTDHNISLATAGFWLQDPSPHVRQGLERDWGRQSRPGNVHEQRRLYQHIGHERPGDVQSSFSTHEGHEMIQTAIDNDT